MDSAAVCNNCNVAFTEQFGMIHEGFWPGSTTGKSPYMFDQDLFRFFSFLRLHSPGVSYGAFIETLEHMSVENGRVSFHMTISLYFISFYFRNQLLIQWYSPKHTLNGDIASLN